MAALEKNVKRFSIYIFSIFLTLPGWSQQGVEISYVIIDTLQSEFSNSIWYVKDNDTLATATMTAAVISGQSTNLRKKEQHDKIEKKVVKVYPYAYAAGVIMNEYALICENITDSKEQKKLLDLAEDELKKQFENDLRSMTVSEGVILIKLIDRETGNTSYSLVQQLKGKLSAFMWQSVAKLFGHNLKDDYDPYGKDVWIENTVLKIEDGTIPVVLKEVDPFHLRTIAQR